MNRARALQTLAAGLLLVAACGPRPKPTNEAPVGAAPVPSASGQPTAAATKLIPRKVLFGNPERTKPQLSPDGTQLSWLAPKDGVLNVWVAPIDKLASARAITDDKSRGIRRYSWSQSSKHVLYAQDKGGDENWRTYAVELSSGKVANLTPEDGIQARLVHLSPKKPDEVLIGLNARDKRFHDVFSVNLATGKRTLVQKNDGFASFIADDQLRVRFGVKPTPDGGSEVLKKHGKFWLPFAKFSPQDEMVSSPRALSGDGKYLYFLDSRGRDRAALTRVALASGKSAVLAEDLKADVTGLLLHPTENVAQAAISVHARKNFIVIDPELKTDFATLLKAAPGDLKIVDRTLDDKRWLVAYSIDTGPTRYHLYERVTRKLTPLFSDRPELEKHRLAPMVPISIKQPELGITQVSRFTSAL